ncbi:hypothetical protein BpHYR1_017613 [Brachionus plicatilis]|uniref:Uncharacterized protein n=1 Tax=Brachionus plicatilis TaxID=10195 RepID=A0A3M7S4D0_BRAPC|nr:hypothetical protein BpHYR1_017613 [Brachionus plicatilis]
MNCGQRENFLVNRIIPVWNKLPHSVVNSPSKNTFKANYDKHRNSAAAIVCLRILAVAMFQTDFTLQALLNTVNTFILESFVLCNK